MYPMQTLDLLRFDNNDRCVCRILFQICSQIVCMRYIHILLYMMKIRFIYIYIYNLIYIYMCVYIIFCFVLRFWVSLFVSDFFCPINCCLYMFCIYVYIYIIKICKFEKKTSNIKKRPKIINGTRARRSSLLDSTTTVYFLINHRRTDLLLWAVWHYPRRLAPRYPTDEIERDQVKCHIDSTK